MAVPETTLSFEVHTEVTSAYYPGLLAFIYQNYLLPLSRNISNVRQWVVEGRNVLAFTLWDLERRWQVDAELEAGGTILLRMRPSGPSVPKSVLDRLREDLIINVQLFEETIRRTTLYFAFVKDKKIMLERPLQKRKKALSRIFLGNMLVLFVIFILISYVAFLVFQLYTPIVLVLSQLVIVLLADKILGRMGDWSITPSNPYVYILQYHIPLEEFPAFSRRFNRDLLLDMKREIYEKTLALGKPIDCQTAQEVFSKYGLFCRPENFSTKTVDVYRLVREAAARFDVSVPKIKIANIILPNAGATGPTPSRGLVLITTGLLVQLEEEEIYTVVGHEISHLKRRDPLALFGLTSVEYLLRVYVFIKYISLFGFLYFFVALSGIYFIAKFFEARADLESAIKIGRPQVLAEALRKIGFRKIQIERVSYSRIGNWLGMDPHPPVSFRVARLENLDDPSKIKHPFLKSIVDCVTSLLRS